MERHVLITGGNKGLGYATAHQLKDEGLIVTIGARDAGRGAEAAARLGVDWVHLDVTESGSVEAAARETDRRRGRLDILINNAGISGGYREVGDITGMDAMTVFDTNVAGPVRVIHAFLPLLRRSAAPVIVNVSSGMGSFGYTHDPERVESSAIMPIYTASKSALTMLTTQYARALPDMRVNAVDPGYTATDFTANRGTNTVEQGIEPIVRLAMVPPDGPTGTIQGRDGPLPW